MCCSAAHRPTHLRVSSDIFCVLEPQWGDVLQVIPVDEEEPTNLQQHMHTMQSLCHTPTSNVCKGQPTQLGGKKHNSDVTAGQLLLAHCQPSPNCPHLAVVAPSQAVGCLETRLRCRTLTLCGCRGTKVQLTSGILAEATATAMAAARICRSLQAAYQFLLLSSALLLLQICAADTPFPAVCWAAAAATADTRQSC